MNKKLELKTSIIKILLCTLLIMSIIPSISQAANNGFTVLVNSPSITIKKPSTNKLESIKITAKAPSSATLNTYRVYNGETENDKNLFWPKLTNSKKSNNLYTEMEYTIEKNFLPEKNKSKTLKIWTKASNMESTRKVIRITNKDGKYYALDNAPNVSDINYANNKISLTIKSTGDNIKKIEIKDYNANNKAIYSKSSINKKTATINLDRSKVSLKNDSYYRMTVYVYDKNGAYTIKEIAFKLPVESNINIAQSNKENNNTAEKIEVKSYKLNKSRIMIEKGTSTNLKTTNIQPQNATLKTPTFTSSNTQIVTVDKSGNVYGVKPGTATITVKMDNIKTKITVTVLPIGDKVYFLDVQDMHNGAVQGSDAIVIESNGKYGMIDTGVSYQKERVLQYLKDLDVKELEFILITHLHSDHYGGYEKIANSSIKVKNLYIKDAKANNQKEILDKIIQVSKKNNIKVNYVSPTNNKNITLGNYKFELLNREIHTLTSNTLENINSIVALAKVNNKTIYFAGDIQNDPTINDYAEDETAKKVGKVDIYKAAHHLYYTNNTSTALKYLKPGYAIITNVKNRPTGTAAAKARLDKYVSSKNQYYTADGTQILTINQNGTISFTQLEADG